MVIVPFDTEIFDLEEGIDLILGMDWLRVNTKGLSWDITDELIFRPGVGLSGANAERPVAHGANVERLVAQAMGAKAERQVALNDGVNADVLVTQNDRVNADVLVAQTEGVNLERVVTQGEKLEVDIQVVSSLSEWDEVVAESFAIGCIWNVSSDKSDSV